MFKWESEEDRQTLVAPPAPGRPWRPRRLWLVLLAGLVLLGMAGLALLRGRLAERQQAMRQDVAAFVEREERARLFGQRDLAPELVAPGVPRSWYSDYLETFVPADEARPLDLTIEDVTFDGTGALVTLRLDGRTQARYYRLAGREWRRAPLPNAAWGAALMTAGLPNDRTVVFRPRDAAFARSVARDLPALFDQLARWPGELGLEQIEIEPTEFHEALVLDEGTRIILNSPLLVPLDEELDGEATVRLALAEALFQRAGPEPVTIPPLPGSDRFVSAAKTVAISRWSLPAEAQASRREEWRSRLHGQWLSPFFGVWITQGDETVAPAPPQQAEAAALLVADFIHRAAGPQALATVIRELLGAATWDQVFQDTLGRPTITVEGDVVASEGLSGGPPPDVALSLNRLPLATKVLRVDLPSARQLYVGGPSPHQPVLVELPNARDLVSAEGVPLSCISPHSIVDIEGTWLDVGYRLRANRITIRELAMPIVLEPPPPDTIAYLIERFVETSQSRATLVALRAGGTTVPVAELAAAAYSATPFVVTSADSLGIIFRLELPDCDRALLILHDLTHGTDSQWLAPPARRLPGTSWLVPRAEQQDLLLFQASTQRTATGPTGRRTWQYSLLKRDNRLVVQPRGDLDPSLQPWGWSAATDRIVAVSPGETLRVALIDPTSQATTWLDLPSGPIGIPSRPSVDGRWLAYLTHSQGRSSTFDTLRALNLVSGEEVTVLRGAADEGLFWATWSANPNDDRLLVPAGRVVNGHLEVTRLLIVRATQPGIFSVAAQIAEGEQLFGDPVLCPDDRILYTVETGTRFLVRLHAAGAAPVTVLEARHPLRPLACPGPTTSRSLPSGSRG